MEDARIEIETSASSVTAMSDTTKCASRAACMHTRFQRCFEFQPLIIANLCSRFVCSVSPPCVLFFWVLVCYAATQLATQLPQRRIQVVRSNKVARKRLTESNSTPAIDLVHMDVVLK